VVCVGVTPNPDIAWSNFSLADQVGKDAVGDLCFAEHLVDNHQKAPRTGTSSTNCPLDLSFLPAHIGGHKAKRAELKDAEKVAVAMRARKVG